MAAGSGKYQLRARPWQFLLWFAMDCQDQADLRPCSVTAPSGDSHRFDLSLRFGGRGGGYEHHRHRDKALVARRNSHSVLIVSSTSQPVHKKVPRHGQTAHLAQAATTGPLGGAPPARAPGHGVTLRLASPKWVAMFARIMTVACCAIGDLAVTAKI